MMIGIIPMVQYTIDVPEEVWMTFKATVDRNRTINDRVVELIEEDINE
jgi:hypothetical protein